MLLIALALAQAAPFDTKADYMQLARQYCAKEAAAGMLQFKRVSDELGKPIEKALEQCTEKWTTDRLPNWQMIGYCATSQAEAYRRLNPTSP